MIFEHTDFRSYLRSRFAADLAKNPRYSLRAFARKVGVAPSTLSEILSAKKGVSNEMAHRFAAALGLDDRETEYFCTLTDFENSKSESVRSRLADRLKQMNPDRPIHNLSVETFRIISEWYHLAILEMTGLAGFKYEPRTIAARLGISAIQVREAIERLERVGLIEKDERGRYVKISENNLVSSHASNEALRRYHTQMLEKAAESLVQQGPKERFVGSETFAFDDAKLAKAEEILEDCFQRMVALANKTTKPDHVFHLGIQFFALTKGNQK